MIRIGDEGAAEWGWGYSPVTYYWVAAGVILAVIGTVVGSYSVATLGLLLPVGVGVAWLWARYALSRVTYARTLSADRLYAGESVELELSLANAKPLLVPWISVEEQLEASDRFSYVSYTPRSRRIVVRDLDREDAGDELLIRQTLSLSWYERIRWRYSLLCPKRGRYAVGPTRLFSGDPFGFYERSKLVHGAVDLLVYPRLIPLEELGLPNRFPFEGLRTSTALLADPLNIVGARPYEEGDTPRQVHWRASARHVQLQSKVVRPTAERSIVLFLDLASEEHAWQGMNEQLVEEAISTAATLAHRVHAARWALGLYVNGLHVGTHQSIRIGASRGDDALAGVMAVLARVPAFPMMDFAEMLRQERRRLAPGVSVVAITALCTPEVREEVDLFKRTGRDVLLLDIRARAAARWRASEVAAR